MQARHSDIRNFFDGSDLRHEDVAKNFLNNKLHALTRKKLLCALFQGDANYVNNQPVKAVYTLGIATIFRAYKSSIRIPNEITDANAKQKLKEFLLGSGNNDINSLKYKVLEELFFVIGFKHLATGELEVGYLFQAKTNQQANNIIEMTLDLLGHKKTLQLASIRR